MITKSLYLPPFVYVYERDSKITKIRVWEKQKKKQAGATAEII